ncbi:MAG: DUF294 nucleotidyltransferase-like domain-containing protein [Alphaproteobacteria bacterium]|nr:DUF294 nucleotidyltransferase-like domain-containing protein [Alphaproteobacteria bacterium]
MTLPAPLSQFLASLHPYDSLEEGDLARLSETCTAKDIEAGETIFSVGDPLTDLYIVVSGEVEILEPSGDQISLLGPRNSFGERALLASGVAGRTALAVAPSSLILLPGRTLFALIEQHPAVARFFERGAQGATDRKNLATFPVGKLMTPDPVTCTPETSIQAAARRMYDADISSVCISDATGLCGIVTVQDINGWVATQGGDPSAPVSDIMTSDPLSLGPDALGTDVLHLMMERSVGHVPIVQDGALLGIVTQTDLTRAQAMSSGDLVRRLSRADSAEQMARTTAEIPRLLAQLVGAGNRHDVVTRLVTDIADTATRRLLALAEEKLGAPPVPYLWLACGSQGRQEQTGVSDQDNCLILSDDATKADDAYFEELARFVSDGLDVCGYYYCPGDMMATNPRWRQPLRVWRDYFAGWIAQPNPEAQMLASVMFDLRPIGGDVSLFSDLQSDTLEKASRNSIFVAHMISNSLKHQPPLGLLGGLARVRSGEYRNRVDLKLNGVVPIVDLGRIYTLQGRLAPVNTRARLEAAIAAGAVSREGGADLIAAYDLIADTRLEHQAGQIAAGEKPDNFVHPSKLSDFERSHLRDAFVVVKTMQSAAGSGKGTLG